MPKQMSIIFSRTAVALFFAAALSACGGGSSNDSDQGSLSLALTDAPVDEVFVVQLRLTGVTIKPQNGAQIPFEFEEPIDVDLLSLTGGRIQQLIQDERVPAGRYEWIRFDVVEDVAYTYVRLTDGGDQLPLRVPSDRLRFVSGFTVTVDRTTSLVFDWVVRKGLTDPVGQEGFLLRPAFRVVDATEYAAIAGTVHPDLIELDTESCDNDPETLAGNTVYLYNDMSGAPESDFDDIYITEALEEGPLTTANVEWDEGMNYSYRVDFVPPGSYTLAFTCQGLADDPAEDADIEFRAFVDVTIEDGVDGAMPADVTDADFTPPVQ